MDLTIGPNLWLFTLTVRPKTCERYEYIKVLGSHTHVYLCVCVCNLVEKPAEAGDFLLQVSSLDHQLVADGLGLLLRV